MELINSLNKVTIFALVVAFGFLLYQLYLFRQTRHRKGNISIPEFNGQKLDQAAPIPAKAKKSKNSNFVILTVAATVFTALVLILTLQIVSSRQKQVIRSKAEEPVEESVEETVEETAEEETVEEPEPTLVAALPDPTATPTPEPTLEPTMTPTEVPLPTELPSPTPVIPVSGGLPHYAVFMFGAALALILVSFVL